MPRPDVLAVDRWTPSVWDAVLDRFVDPLERIMLVALAVLSAWLLVVLATQEDADVTSVRDTCVVTVVDDARAFAAVLGDDRPVSYAFARRSCEQR